MAMIQLYSHAETRVFRSSVCSKATFFSLFALLLLLLPPFFIAFAGRTFWLKEDFYLDVPLAAFAHKAIVILDGESGSGKTASGDYRIFSTFENLNLLHADKFVPASISVEPSSSSSSVKISVFPGVDFRVGSVTALLFYNYDLSTYTRVSLEGMAFIQRQLAFTSSSSSSSSPSGLWVDGELRLRQASPLPHRGVLTQFNSSVVNETATSIDDFSPKTILRSYKSRALRLDSRDVDVLWNFDQTDETSDVGFTLETHFRFPEERVFYRPGVAQMLKWAWIQYLSIFAIFYFVIERIKAFVYLNQIIPTVVQSRLDKVKRL